MNSIVHAAGWYAGTLRAWHLAILRYAVTRDNADRLAVFRIALEIDSLEPGQDGPADFDYFRRTSTELCSAILQPDTGTSPIFQQYLARIEDQRLKRALAAAIDTSEPAASPEGRAVRRGSDLWKGLASGKNR
jgi:hypothetical protein